MKQELICQIQHWVFQIINICGTQTLNGLTLKRLFFSLNKLNLAFLFFYFFTSLSVTQAWLNMEHSKWIRLEAWSQTQFNGKVAWISSEGKPTASSDRLWAGKESHAKGLEGLIWEYFRRAFLLFEPNRRAGVRSLKGPNLGCITVYWARIGNDEADGRRT